MILALTLFRISSAHRPSARKNYMVPYISKVNMSKTCSEHAYSAHIHRSVISWFCNLCMEPDMFDFHTHTFLSDGVLSPVELIRRAHVAGYRVMAITDHVGHGNLEFILKTLIKDCEVASKNWDILALPGVEITHTPKDEIDYLARAAREMGARVVNVHGETINEPVEPGTNHAAVSSAHVDVLAHPGLIHPEDAQIAADNGIFLEVSARKGHGMANGHVVRMAKSAGSAVAPRLRRPRAG